MVLVKRVHLMGRVARSVAGCPLQEKTRQDGSITKTDAALANKNANKMHTLAHPQTDPEARTSMQARTHARVHMHPSPRTQSDHAPLSQS